MANLNPGHYRFEVHYKSPVAFNMPASLDLQSYVYEAQYRTRYRPAIRTLS